VWEELRAVRAQLAQLILAPLMTAQGDARRKELKALNDKKEDLERQLAQLNRSFEHRQAADRASFADLAAKLPRGTAVVDIVDVVMLEPVKKGSTDLHGTRHYEAFVLQPAAGGYSLDWVHLGPAAPIDKEIRAWRKLITARQPPPAAEVAAAPEQRLRKLVWEPIERKLSDCDTIIVIPDGVLTTLPWCGLPGPTPDSYLVDQYAFGIASHGQLLVELADRPAPAGDRLLAVGGVNYGRNPKYPSDQQSNAYLKKSLPEATHIADLSRIAGYEPELLSGLDASVAAVQARMPGARFVHLATHGTYLDPQIVRKVLKETPSRDAALSPTTRAAATARNPLAYSALSLANANLPPKLNFEGLPEGGSGTLTAEEIVEMDLSGTEMVVLSACQTALGEVAGGEGVLGLQRAFGLAGARTVVATLWSIPDDELLMPLFYLALWKNQVSRVEALRQAQLTIRKKLPETPADMPWLAYKKTAYWAAWTVSGDPGNLLRGK
jgi:CHAT domain-containing protein